MKPIVLSDVLAVGEFPSIEQLEILAKAGFKSIINNQPDGEVERFPGSEIVAAEAKRLGLRHVYVPIVSRVPSVGELVAFAKAVKDMPDPIYAFCYSGARSAAASAFIMAETSEVAEILTSMAEAGFDVRTLVPWLEDERARHVAARKKAAAATGSSLSGTGASRGGEEAQKSVQAATLPMLATEQIVVLPRVAGFGGYAM